MKAHVLVAHGLNEEVAVIEANMTTESHLDAGLFRCLLQELWAQLLHQKLVGEALIDEGRRPREATSIFDEGGCVVSPP